MSQQPERSRSDDLISRRRVLRGGLAAATLAALSSCDHTVSPASNRASPSVVANVRVSQDTYGVHVGPTVAVNPRQPRHLLVACGVSSTPNPELVATYLSSDGGASWTNGGLPPAPEAGPAGDDVTVAFDGRGRGYVCATRAGHSSTMSSANPDANRAVYIWRTDDGGRSFSAPVTLVQAEYCDHPYVAAEQAQTSSGQSVYVAWGAGASHTALDFTRSNDGGETFDQPRRILPEATSPSLMSAGPELATGPNGLVCAVCEWTSHEDASGDMIGEVVVVCSTDAGRSFAAPIHLGSDSAVIGLPHGVMPNSMPTVATSPDGDAVYVAFATHHPGATHSDIVVTASFDSGRTWSAAVRATPADAVTYFQPNLTVDATGAVAISAFALSGGRVDHVLLFAPPRELRFGTPLRVSTESFDPHNSMPSGGKHGAWWIGDYQGIAAGAGAVHCVWNDTRTGKLELFAATVRP